MHLKEKGSTGEAVPATGSLASLFRSADIRLGESGRLAEREARVLAAADRRVHPCTSLG